MMVDQFASSKYNQKSKQKNNIFDLEEYHLIIKNIYESFQLTNVFDIVGKISG